MILATSKMELFGKLVSSQLLTNCTKNSILDVAGFLYTPSNISGKQQVKTIFL